MSYGEALLLVLVTWVLVCWLSTLALWRWMEMGRKKRSEREPLDVWPLLLSDLIDRESGQVVCPPPREPRLTRLPESF